MKALVCEQFLKSGGEDADYGGLETEEKEALRSFSAS